MPKLISEMTTREVRALKIETRRKQNAIARRLGFKNFNEWQGDEA